VKYEVFDSKGDLVAYRSGFITPASSRYNTWKMIPIFKGYNEPGEWRFVVYFNDQGAIETKLTVSP
jgi:hypothetical protein